MQSWIEDVAGMVRLLSDEAAAKSKNQEYLDRQDSDTLLFFIKSSTTGIPRICPRMKVNGWSIRLNDSELES